MMSVSEDHEFEEGDLDLGDFPESELATFELPISDLNTPQIGAVMKTMKTAVLAKNQAKSLLLMPFARNNHF